MTSLPDARYRRRPILVRGPQYLAPRYHIMRKKGECDILRGDFGGFSRLSVNVFNLTIRFSDSVLLLHNFLIYTSLAKGREAAAAVERSFLRRYRTSDVEIRFVLS